MPPACGIEPEQAWATSQTSPSSPSRPTRKRRVSRLFVAFLGLDWRPFARGQLGKQWSQCFDGDGVDLVVIWAADVQPDDPAVEIDERPSTFVSANMSIVPQEAGVA